jgi:hypothetical protein
MGIARSLGAALMGILLVAPTVTADHRGSLDCGSLAPLDNACEKGDFFKFSDHPSGTFNILGFVGHIEMELFLFKGFDLIRKWTWSCDVVLVAEQPPTTCDPILSERFDQDPSSSSDVFMLLHCQATPLVVRLRGGDPLIHVDGSIQVVPPMNFYGCSVAF